MTQSLQHSTAQHSTAQHSTAQHSTAQHSTAQHSTAQHSTARVLWIDVSRVIAAFLIMLVHLPHGLVANWSGHFFFSGRVPFFLVLAGYFVARDITWRKAWNRALWLFVPFAFWTLFAGVYTIVTGEADMKLASDWTFWLGVRDVFVPGWNPFDSPDKCSWPPIAASWFLKDIICLTLITPWLARCKGVLLPVVLLLSAFSPLGPEGRITLSLGTCAFYMLGVFLSTYSIQDIYRVFDAKFRFIFLGCLLLPLAFPLDARWLASWKETQLGMLLGVMLLMYSGILIAQYLPRLARYMAAIAPACFLIFMLHVPFYTIFHKVMRWSWMIPYLPILVFVMIVSGYVVLKRFLPWLLPYVAHVNYPKNY